MKTVGENLMDEKEIPNGCKATAIALAFIVTVTFVLGIIKLIEIVASWI